MSTGLQFGLVERKADERDAHSLDLRILLMHNRVLFSGIFPLKHEPNSLVIEVQPTRKKQMSKHG